MQAEDGVESQLLNLQAIQLWCAEVISLPVPVVVNFQMAPMISSPAGKTEVVSTTAAHEDPAPDLRVLADIARICHRYAHSRPQIDDQLAHGPLFTR